MKKSEVSKVKLIVERELSRLGKGWDMKPVVRVNESEHSKGWWGLYVYTDSTAYDEFYETYNSPVTFKNRDRVMAVVDRVMGWKSGDHYFENYGQGIVMLF